MTTSFAFRRWVREDWVQPQIPYGSIDWVCFGFFCSYFIELKRWKRCAPSILGFVISWYFCLRTYMLNVPMDFYEWNHSTRFSSDRDILSSVNSTVLMSLATLIWLYWAHVLLKYAVPSISVCSPLFTRSYYCLVELQGGSFSPLNATLHCWKLCAESLKNERSEGSLSFIVGFLLINTFFAFFF